MIPAETRGARRAPAVGERPGFLRAFQDLRREHGFEPLRLEGAIPAELDGTLFRAGPALFASFGRRYGHWFDGDGAVSAVRFRNGAARGAVRLVQSDGLVTEREAGRPLFAGYGTRPPGLRRFLGGLKNAANTAVLAWQGRLFALWEGGLPTEVSPADLATLGTDDLGGVVVGAFSAHPHRVAGRGATYNFGVRYGARTVIDLFELPDAGAPRRLATLPLAGATMIHDFIATEHHLVVFAPPLRLDVLAYAAGRSYERSLRWRPSLGTEILVIPLAAPERVVRFAVEPFFQWHFANAFEEGGVLLVDFARYPDFATNDYARSLMAGHPVRPRASTLHRAEIDVAARTARFEERAAIPCEFPRVAPAREGRRHRFVYAAEVSAERIAESALQDRIAKIDVERGAAGRLALGPGQTVSEPVFVPRPRGAGEDDGWLLTLVYDAPSHTSHVAVLDARDLAVGPIARAWFDQHVPLTFHGAFVPG
ncbi:MAG TPA: carotenoid oxygenase family protein [Anaeromyxobacteraceae bacterium]|nr:carotenoid oxygenase family protein [Anaeromyxobacteraceae bacterium]